MREPLRLKGMERKIALVRKRAAQETFEFRPLHFTPPAHGSVDPDNPRYVIRAVYGPVNGLPSSRIMLLNYQERYLQQRGFDLNASDIRDNVDDGAGVGLSAWGPKRFLWELFRMIAERGGDCTIYLTHSDQVVQVDAEAFEKWVRHSQEDPATALLAPARLLEDRHGV